MSYICMHITATLSSCCLCRVLSGKRVTPPTYISRYVYVYLYIYLYLYIFDLHIEPTLNSCCVYPSTLVVYFVCRVPSGKRVMPRTQERRSLTSSPPATYLSISIYYIYVHIGPTLYFCCLSFSDFDSEIE